MSDASWAEKDAAVLTYRRDPEEEAAQKQSLDGVAGPGRGAGRARPSCHARSGTSCTARRLREQYGIG